MAEVQGPVKVVSKREHYLQMILIVLVIIVVLFFLGQLFIAMPIPFLVFVFFILIFVSVVLIAKDRKRAVNSTTIALSVAQHIYDSSGVVIDTSPSNLQIGLIADGIYYAHDKHNGLVFGYSTTMGPFESSLSNLARTRRRLEKAKYFATFEQEMSAKKELESVKQQLGIKEVKV